MSDMRKKYFYDNMNSIKKTSTTFLAYIYFVNSVIHCSLDFSPFISLSNWPLFHVAALTHSGFTAFGSHNALVSNIIKRIINTEIKLQL